jgi:hypothetical protein
MDPVTQYVLLICITIIFSVLALERNSITFHLLAAFTWFITALGHLAIGTLESPLTSTLAFLYLGIGLIFTVSTTDKAIAFLKVKRENIEL